MNALLAWMFIVTSSMFWHELIYNPPDVVGQLIGYLAGAISSFIMATVYIFLIIRDWRNT
jgi:hypothetical protein